jgi:hypothetical protein
MRKCFVLFAAVTWLLAGSDALHAAVKVVSERSGDAGGAFRFKDVPAPSRTDLGNKAKFTVAAGRIDGNGGGVQTLNDGRLPSDEDQPPANFFFAANTDGGRILVDLGEVGEIEQVNTYSWHRGGRGPQVYKLYGHQSSGESAGEAEVEKSGWKLVASVDTRPKEGPVGGQYGVTIGDDGGGDGAIGKFRYLLFVVSRTDADDPFGLTFFSEIDVVDGKEHPPALAAVAPAVPPFSVMVQDKYEITFDTSEVPELKEWVETKLKPVCVEWYPKIVGMLPSEGYAAPTKFSITFRREMRGVAFASGSRITCAGDWFKKNLEGEAVGAVVHEMVHVVQQYGRARGTGNRNPGWLVEGLADYIRWFLYEPESKRPRVNPARAKYTDSYRTTGAFLNYLMEKHDKEIVKKLNAAMREGKYTAEIWTELTGKTVDELWGEYVKTLPTP